MVGFSREFGLQETNQRVSNGVSLVNGEMPVPLPIAETTSQDK